MTEKFKSDLDPSLAFTALLEVPEFRALESREADRVQSLFLADWYNAPDRNMFAYAQKWAAGYFNS